MQAINWWIINILKKGIINYYETGNLKLDWDAAYFFNYQLSIINYQCILLLPKSGCQDYQYGIYFQSAYKHQKR